MFKNQLSVTGAILVILGSLSSYGSTVPQGIYAGRLAVEAPELASDTCDVEVKVQMANNKITVERHAKKCDKFQLKQKNQKFDLDVSGETLSSKGEVVGTFKDGAISAKFNIADIYLYVLSVSINANQNLEYSEVLWDVSGFTSDMQVNVHGELSPKKK